MRKALALAAALCVSCAPYQKRLAAEFDADGRIVFLKARYGMWKMVGGNYSTEKKFRHHRAATQQGGISDFLPERGRSVCNGIKDIYNCR